MENQIAKITPISDEILTQFLDMFGQSKLNKEEKTKFIQISKAFNLNPFKREIHLVKFGNDCSIIVGYESYIKRGESTGLLNGWSCKTEGEARFNEQNKTWSGDLKAIIQIKRKDFAEPFIHEVDFIEFASSKPNWVKMPKFMIKKVAIGQGFRLCFSTEMGGLPYTEEEFESMRVQKTIDIEPVELNEMQSKAIDLLNSANIDTKSFEHIKKGILESHEDSEKLQKAIDYLTEKQPKNEPNI